MSGGAVGREGMGQYNGREVRGWVVQTEHRQCEV